MSKHLTFEVFGKRMIVETSSNEWQLFLLGAGGKRTLLEASMPAFVAESGLEQFWVISFTKTRVGGIRTSVTRSDLLAQEASVILEVAVLNVRMGSEAAYEAAFQQASSIISAMPGYISHQLQRCIEIPNRYLLLVNWESLEAHTVGFRDSSEYQNWKRLLHHFYDPFPTVEHYESVLPRAA